MFRQRRRRWAVTVTRHWINISFSPGNTSKLTQKTQDIITFVLLMLAEHHRRWANIKTTLGQCLVFFGNISLIFAVLGLNIYFLEQISNKMK